MSFKDNLTPVNNIPGITPKLIGKLRLYQITTAEELLGQIEAEPQTIGNLLRLDDSEIQLLKTNTRKAIPKDILATMDAVRGKQYQTGAKAPDER